MTDPATGSLADLVQVYRRSPEFARLADRTRHDYGRYLEWYALNRGELIVAQIDREFVIETRDAYAETPRAADYRVQMLSLLLKCALDRPRRFGLNYNPALQVSKLAKPDGYKAWPDDLVLEFRRRAYAELVWVMELGQYTGQRSGDLTRMAWGHFDGRGIAVAQSKTGQRLTIPVHPVLLRVLSEIPKRATTILTNRSGQPWHVDHLRHEIARVVEALGFTGYSGHGLRKRAGKMLAEAGCTEHEIASILGHKSLAMVQLYTREADRCMLAERAIGKLTEME